MCVLTWEQVYRVSVSSAVCQILIDLFSCMPQPHPVMIGLQHRSCCISSVTKVTKHRAVSVHTRCSHLTYAFRQLCADQMHVVLWQAVQHHQVASCQVVAD